MAGTRTSRDHDDMMDITTSSRHLLAKMAAISPSTSQPIKLEARPDTDYYVKKRTALARGMIQSHYHMTSDLKKAKADMEQTEQEVEWFLRKERALSNRRKYQVLKRPEEFVSQFDKYSIADYADISVNDYTKPPV